MWAHSLMWRCPLPSSKSYKRNYRVERANAKKRGETGVGSKSGDATRHRARRKKLGGKSSSKDVDHRKPLKSGGSNAKSNLRFRSKTSNRSAGGKAGSRAGKAAGARKGHRSRKR